MSVIKVYFEIIWICPYLQGKRVTWQVPKYQISKVSKRLCGSFTFNILLLKINLRILYVIFFIIIFIVYIFQICLAYQKGELPANLHYTEPLDVPAVKEGKLQIVTNNTSFGRGYVAINNFSFNGSSYHALLKGHFIPKVEL